MGHGACERPVGSRRRLAVAVDRRHGIHDAGTIQRYEGVQRADLGVRVRVRRAQKAENAIPVVVAFVHQRAPVDGSGSELVRWRRYPAFSLSS